MKQLKQRHQKPMTVGFPRRSPNAWLRGLLIATLLAAGNRLASGASITVPAGSLDLPRGTGGCPEGRWVYSPYAFDARAPGGVTVTFEDLDLFDVHFTDPSITPFEILAGVTAAPPGVEFHPPAGSVWLAIEHNWCGSGTTDAPCYRVTESYRPTIGLPAQIIPTNGAWNAETKGGPPPGGDREYDTFDLRLEITPRTDGRFNLVASMLRHEAGDPGNETRDGVVQVLLPSPAIVGSPGIDLSHVHAFVGLRFAQCGPGTDSDSSLRYGPVRVVGQPVTELRLTIPEVAGPSEPIVARVELTSALPLISALGTRLSFDAAAFQLAGPDSIRKGAGLPASWDFVFRETAPGTADLVVTDITPAAATIAGPIAGAEVARLTFQRKGRDCTPSRFGFNSAPPGAGAPAAAFPANQFALFNDPAIRRVVLSLARTEPADGPRVEDHAFIRGNLNNRAVHRLDLGDVVDLVGILFNGLSPPRCEAAADVNDDGRFNVTDVVNLLQGIFRPGSTAIKPPNADLPGLGAPGVVVPDGGQIPSVFGCEVGETCP